MFWPSYPFVVIILVLFVEGYELWGSTFSNLIYLLPQVQILPFTLLNQAL